jgi:hypothetical protein
MYADTTRNPTREEAQAVTASLGAPAIQVDRLASYISACFTQSESYRTNYIFPKLKKCSRLKEGIYETDKLAAISKTGGCTTFFNITETKVEALEAWIGDVLSTSKDERLWSIEPTPIPDLPQDMKASIVERVTQQVMGGFVTGEFDPTNIDPAQVMALASQMYDDEMTASFDAAKRRCERAQTKMRDQMVDGKWQESLLQFVGDLSEMPFAVLKGPVTKLKKQATYVNGEYKTVLKPVPCWSCVNPYDFFPAPNARDPNEGWICEMIMMNPSDLQGMRGRDGWSTEAIDAVLFNSYSPSGLNERGAQNAPYISGESDRAFYENRDTTVNSGFAQGMIRGIEFWGPATGDRLMEWGMTGVESKFVYEINAILVGNRVLRAVLNKDPLERRPYYVGNFMRRRDSMVGKGLAEKMEDCQDATNSALRASVNNIGIAAGPQASIDIDLIPPEVDCTKIWPFKVWPYHGNDIKGGSHEPVKFFQPVINSEAFLRIAEFFKNEADERTLVPRYQYGDQDISGAGQTASGLSMLMNASARGVKRVIRDIDANVIRPAVERLYVWNMVNTPDEEWAQLKGDAQVVPRGAIAMLLKDQTVLRQQEFLQMTNNPTDMQIIGMQGRAEMLRSIAKSMDLPDDIIPPKEQLMQQAEQQLMQQQQQIMGADADAGDEQGGDDAEPA